MGSRKNFFRKKCVTKRFWVVFDDSTPTQKLQKLSRTTKNTSLGLKSLTCDYPHGSFSGLECPQLGSSPGAFWHARNGLAVQLRTTKRECHSAIVFCIPYSCVATTKQERESAIVFCTLQVAPRHVLDVSRVTTSNHECRSSMVFCIPWIAPCNVLDVSCVKTTTHEAVVPSCLPSQSCGDGLDVSRVRATKCECHSATKFCIP